ncbi:MAG TPA: serine hydrolase domain-containing protein [Trebonia sp.]|nr:serine hydrolase domain-containing protein [Trebonia sp.]
MSDQPGAAAPDNSRDLPDRLSLRHSKLETKRRLAAGEFTTLHDAQLAVAREHGMSSWAALKEHIAAAEAEHGRALPQMRWVFARFAGAGAPGWAAPSRDELSEHFTERFLGFASPDEIARTLAGLAGRLSEDLVVTDAGSLGLSARAGNLRVEASVEPESPHRLDMLRFFFSDDVTVTDERVARPPAANVGPVPGPVPGLVEDSRAKFGLVGVAATGNAGTGPGSEVWTCARGWADLEGNVPLEPGHRFPACQITTLITATAVLCLVADRTLALDDPVNGHLRSLRLADDTITVRELLAHTGGIDSPPSLSLWADSVSDVPAVLGPVAGCSGPRGEFAYSDAGYAVLGQLITDLTGTPFAQAATRLVLEPLGMADSWFPSQAPAPPDAACGYRLEEAGSLVRQPPQVFALQSAGGLWSTGPDLVRFGSGWRTLLPGELAEQALHPQVPQRDPAEETGLGWGLRRPMDAAGQAGAGPGFAASLIIRPSTSRTIVVLTNRLFTVLALNVELIRSAA